MKLCMFCTQKNHSSKLERLKLLQQTIYSHKIIPVQETDTHDTFFWHIHSNCNYGISCNHLRQMDMEAERIATRLEPYLTSIALQDSEIYYTVLNLLSGYFPEAYNTMVSIHQRGCIAT